MRIFTDKEYEKRFETWRKSVRDAEELAWSRIHPDHVFNFLDRAKTCATVDDFQAAVAELTQKTYQYRITK